MLSQEAIDHRESRGTGEWGTVQEDECNDDYQEQHKNVNLLVHMLMLINKMTYFHVLLSQALLERVIAPPEHVLACLPHAVSSLLFVRYFNVCQQSSH